MGLIWLRIGTGDEHCDCGNEPSGSIKCGEILTSRLATQEGLCSVE